MYVPAIRKGDDRAMDDPVTLPADNHSHTEWSWDASEGSMEGSCARAVELGLPSIAFTEHVDATRWVIAAVSAARHVEPFSSRTGADGQFDPPPLDVEGYLACLARCRDRYPGLRIYSGVELGEPHWFADQSKALLASGAFERVLGSLHSLEVDGKPWIIDELFRDHAPEGTTPHGIVRAYLAGALQMIESSDVFAVLAHIDYPVRGWERADVGPFAPSDFEEEYRAVLRALSRSGRALEVNTRVPLCSEIVSWWHASGGEAVSFGSDAHRPSAVAHGFAEAAAMAEAHGFRPGRHPTDFWLR